MTKEEIQNLVSVWEMSHDLDDYHTARKAVDEALSIDDSDAEIVFHDGYLKQTYGTYFLRLARRAILRCQELAPENGKFHGQFTGLCAALQESHHAVKRYKKLLADHAEDPTYYFHLAFAYYKAAQYVEAEPTLDAGRRLRPSDSSMLYLLGEIRAKQGMKEEALRCWERAFELDPDAADPLYSKAFLLEEDDRLEEALEEWKFIRSWNIEHGFEVYNTWPEEQIKKFQRLIGERGREKA